MEQSILAPLIEAIKGTTLPIQIIMFILIGGFIMMYKNAQFRDDVISVIRRLFRVENKTNLLNKRFFHSLAFYKTLINSIKFIDKHKTDVFIIILNNKIETVVEMVKKFIVEIDINDRETLISFNEKLITNIENVITLYEERILAALVRKYGVDKGECIYTFAYVNGFKPYHEKNIEFIINVINGMVVKNNNKIQILSFYVDILGVALDIAIADINKVFNKFNGQIKKIIEGNELN